MSNNIPVSTLSASLTLDVAGFASGVKQAESLSRRLAKAQADALGGPALRRAGGEGIADQVIRAQELRARSMANAEVQGPVRLRQGNIDAEISAEMAKRVQAAQRRVEVERQAETSIAALRHQALSEDQSLAEAMAAGREASYTRQLTTARALEQVRREASEETARQVIRNEQLMDDAVQAAADSRMRAANAAYMEQRRINKALGIDFVEQGRLDTRSAQSGSAFNDLPANFEKLKPQAAAAEYALRSIGNTSMDSQKKMRDFNLRILQGGYQLQDFVVQVGAGQNALVAFAQQGSQMAGFFGKKGAWVGVGLAVASLAANMLLLKSRTKDNNEETKKTLDMYKQLKDYAKEISRIQSVDTSAFDLADAKEREAKASKEIADYEKRLLSVRSQLDKIAPLDWKTGARDTPLVGRGEATALLKREQIIRKELLSLNLDQSKAARDLVQLERERFDLLKKNRRSVIEALYVDQKPLIDEKMVESLRQVGALTEEQVAAFRTMAQIQKMRSDSDLLIGRTSVEQVVILRRQNEEVSRLGLARSELGEEVGKQLREAERAAKKEAEGYLDQLDPLRQKRRELENIRKLQVQGFLPEGTADKFLMRYMDAARRALKIPDSFAISGAMSSGGFAGNGSASTLLEANRKMLSALEKIVQNTYDMAGNN